MGDLLRSKRHALISTGMPKHAHALPAWLLGLIIAAIVFALVVVLLSALGFGDDPVIDGLAAVLG